MRVLFVCTGNICRSPMAEALLSAELARRGCSDVEVGSAGTWATDGLPAMPEAIDVLAEVEVAGDGHRSRALTPKLIAEAGVIVAMTSVHRNEIEALAPGAGNKVWLIKELARHPGVLNGESPPVYRRSFDLDDPIGLGTGAYRRARREILEGIQVLADFLCSPARPH